jgi:hypothetical protein
MAAGRGGSQRKAVLAAHETARLAHLRAKADATLAEPRRWPGPGERFDRRHGCASCRGGVVGAQLLDSVAGLHTLLVDHTPVNTSPGARSTAQIRSNRFLRRHAGERLTDRRSSSCRTASFRSFLKRVAVR